MHVLQTASPVTGDGYALRVHSTENVTTGHRVGIEVQNTGALSTGGRDDVGIWVRTVNGHSGSTGQANLAAVLDGNVAIGTLSVGNQEIGTQGRYVLSMKDGTAPITPTSAYQGVQLWSQNGELRVMDSSINVTTLSPHNFSLMARSEPMAWSFYSENSRLNQRIGVDMLRLTRVVERLSGERLAVLRRLDEGSKVGEVAEATRPAPGEVAELRAELQQARERLAEREGQVRELAAKMALETPR
jgi:hypothetical protein